MVLITTIGGTEDEPAVESRVDFTILHKLGTALSAVTDRNKSFGKFDTCGEVINATLQASVRLISLAERNNNNCIQTLNNTEKALSLKEKVKLEQLSCISKNKIADFKEAAIEGYLIINDIKNKAFLALKRNFQLGVHVDFNNLSNRVDVEHVPLYCRLDNDNGQAFKSNLKKIYKLIVEDNFPIENLVVGYFVNIEVLLSHRDTFEKKKLDLLKRVYAERNRFFEILINYAEKKNFENIESEEFLDFQKYANEIVANNWELLKRLADL